jgi:hypothetical protein
MTDFEWAEILWHNRSENPSETELEEELEESSEALTIDDSKDREELASLVGLESVPPRRTSNIDSLIGVFDSTAENGEEIDVTEWVRAVRKRSD